MLMIKLLDDAYKLSNNHLRVILLRFPPEIQLAIFEYLHITDRACLALTCKPLGRILDTDLRLLISKQKLQHGNEEMIREFLFECGPSSSADDKELDDWVAKGKMINFEARNYIDLVFIRSFFKRLEKDWSSKTLRLCQRCCKFVSTTNEYWQSRDVFYSYRSNTPLARLWRRGKCGSLCVFENGSVARDYAKKWTEGSAARCPTCEVLSWEHCETCEEFGDGCCCVEHYR